MGRILHGSAKTTHAIRGELGRRTWILERRDKQYCSGGWRKSVVFDQNDTRFQPPFMPAPMRRACPRLPAPPLALPLRHSAWPDRHGPWRSADFRLQLA